MQIENYCLFFIQKVAVSSSAETRLSALMLSTVFFNRCKLRALIPYSFPFTIQVNRLTSLGARITLVIKCSIARERVV